MTGTELFAQQVDQLQNEFPGLKLKEDENLQKIVFGEVDIVDKSGKHWDSYSIEIRPTEDFPNRFPLVYEVGGKIPPIGDWHINQDTKSCCLEVEPEEILRCKKGITLLSFVKEFVLPYFFNQTHRRVEGYYVNGEYSHGVLGIYEFYSRILNTGADIKKTVELIMFISKGVKPSRTDNCFCGVKEKYRRCHRGAFEILSDLGENHLVKDACLIAKKAGLI
jgi:hypothetical protein